MTDWSGKRYWLIGASDGLGAALARKMSAAGIELVLSARSEDKLKELAEDLPGAAEVVTVDVSDAESVRAATEAAGEIDGVVFLAGVYWPFGADAWDAEKANMMADVNFTGAMRCMGEIVPRFVARDRGHIVLTGSLTGYRGLPGSVAYTASKAGVMAMAECMHCDLRQTGVQVQLVSPGFIRTRLTDKNDFKMPQIMEPEKAAGIVFDHMASSKFQRAFPRPFSWVLRGGQFLPESLYYRLFG
ncbi:3-oxoacyl-[acyl-carrier-protein] reductase FabG [Roseivivax jejudonensis]|uniref:3-oxoacyl-[acyl-carrier-protein] reductase FabG n=1 Tax=Roseivivax jejudonensis TaxID=1529041 RepID=A0A1X6ZTX0_9RHOB|nr:SDR family NAD(P)-dependent oxidoreductase [Roseivivax jejudonensis]SLN61544.1 3-oxoacyl-[acyl-carrier-protein] reductase FabG [Roseivivax jejudonensis]